MSTLRKRSPSGGDKLTTAVKKRRMLTSVYEAPWKTIRRIQTLHTIPKGRGFVYMRMGTSPAVSAGEETRQYKYCDFCDDQRSWSRPLKIAASREPAVKINAAKPPRKSWLAAIFMTIGLPIHSKH